MQRVPRKKEYCVLHRKAGARPYSAKALLRRVNFEGQACASTKRDEARRDTIPPYTLRATHRVAPTKPLAP